MYLSMDYIPKYRINGPKYTVKTIHSSSEPNYYSTRIYSVTEHPLSLWWRKILTILNAISPCLVVELLLLTSVASIV